LADAAYLPIDQFRAVAGRLGFSDVRFHSKGSSQGSIAVKDDVIVVAFRGTETKLGDLIDDVKVIGKSDFASDVAGQPAGEVHRGFKSALQRHLARAAGHVNARSDLRTS